MKVMANAIPKSGTHLLMRLLVLLGFKQSSFFLGPHIVMGRYSAIKGLYMRPWSQKDSVPIGVGIFENLSLRWLTYRVGLVRNQSFFGAHSVYLPSIDELLRVNGVKTIAMIRDPRDIAVSYLHYVKANESHFLHESFVRLPNDDDRLMVTIRGGRLGEHMLEPLRDWFDPFLEWERHGNALVVRFEDLVGEKGGGNLASQRRTIERVCAHLNLVVDERKVASIQEELFGSSGTFRKGQIGSWRAAFSEAHRTAMRETFGDWLIEMGYEEGLEW